MTYYLKESEWFQSINVPEGMNLDMINMPDRLEKLLKPSIDNVGPNKIFVDLGCGTGVLGLHALKMGAKFVYFVEKDIQMFHVLQNVLSKKIESSKFKLINEDIEKLTIEQFDHGIPDIIVSEFYGPRLFDEGYVNYTKHVRSLFPDCFFIPEEFIGDFYLTDIDYNQPIWPRDQNLIDHFKFMYKEKGFAKYIDPPLNQKPIGKIVFNANDQTFNNSLRFKYNLHEDQLLYGSMIIRHDDFLQPFTSIGWFLDSESNNKEFEILFDQQYFFNPRLVAK